MPVMPTFSMASAKLKDVLKSVQAEREAPQDRATLRSI